MRVVILLLTLVSQNLAEGNSSLGASFALGGNFGEQQTQKSSFIPKISSKYKTSTANTRIYDLDSATRAKNAESSPDSAKSQNLIANNAQFAESSPDSAKSQNLIANNAQFAESSTKNFVILSVSEESKNNPSLRADSQNLRGNPQGFARAVARSNHPPIKKIQKSQGGLPRSHSLARNDNLLDSSLRLRSAQNDNFKESAESSKKSPQDTEFADSATCKDDIIGFWLSPLDKVSARTSIIEIFKKDGKYFAYNVAFLDELPPKKDALNQNFALRDREILGSVYAYNLERSGEESYINGRYYDFNRGKIFHLKAKLDCDKLILLISADNVGFLGKKKIYKALEKSEAEFYIKTRPTIDFSGVK